MSITGLSGSAHTRAVQPSRFRFTESKDDETVGLARSQPRTAGSASSEPQAAATAAPVNLPASSTPLGASDVRSLAHNAYTSTSRATDLISVLQSLLKDAA